MRQSPLSAPLLFKESQGAPKDLAKDINWAATSFGDPEVWDAKLKDAVTIVKNATCPVFLCWGAHNALIFNEKFASIVKRFSPVTIGIMLDKIDWLAPQVPYAEIGACSQVVRELTYDKLIIGKVLFMPVVSDENCLYGFFGTLIEDSLNGTETSRLHEQKHFFDSILDASFHTIYSLQSVRNTDGEIVDFEYLFINNIGASTLLMDRQSIVGKRLLDLLPESRTNGFFELFCKTLQTQSPAEDEVHFESEVFKGWFNYVIVPIDDNTLVVTAQDITEQRSSNDQVRHQKELLDLVISNAPTALAFCESIRNKSGKITDFKIAVANERAARYTGFSHDEFLSKTLTQIHNENQLTGFTERYIEVVETGVPVEFEYYIARLNIWLHVYIVAVDDGFLSVYDDVTHLKSMQNEQDKLVEELRRTNTNLEEFTYAASHDLKEPVRKIDFFVDHLRTTLLHKLSEDESYTFQRMTLAARRMSSLIDDLLTYSRVSAGREDSEVIDLNELMKLVLNDLDVEIERKRAKVSVEMLPQVRGNHRQLQQAFLNLIGNSLKYARQGIAPEILISVSKASGGPLDFGFTALVDDKRYYCITVSDNGIGFEQSEAEKIFQVFTRLHGSEIFKGNGVGLSIVRKIIENHHGFIRAEGKNDQGANFVILLPVPA